MAVKCYFGYNQNKMKGLYMEYEKFKKILKENDLTLKKFSELSGVKYGTCRHWGKNGRPVSDWVESWLNLYLEKKELEKYRESIQTLMSGIKAS
jgi:hypothetical protein